MSFKALMSTVPFHSGSQSSSCLIIKPATNFNTSSEDGIGKSMKINKQLNAFAAINSGRCVQTVLMR